MQSLFKRVTTFERKFVRLKHKSNHWSVQRKKIHPVDKALGHFNDFYSEVFSSDWNSIKDALLRKQKYVAVINNYGDVEDTVAKLEATGALNLRTLFNLEAQYLKEGGEGEKKNKTLKRLQDVRKLEEKAEEISKRSKEEVKKSFSLESSLKSAELDESRLVDIRNSITSTILQEFIPTTKIKGKEDWIPESDHYKYYDSSEFPIEMEEEQDIHFPDHLNVYTYERSNYSDFKSPKRGITGVLNYYLMDGSSVLPVLALDLKPGDRILDMCASPGGKSFLALQTLYPDIVVMNDISLSRVNRIFDVLKEYFYDLDEKFLKKGRIKVINLDGRNILEDNFDKILVDVPCTTDRHSVTENDNNIFKAGRIKERLKLPELQAELLAHALKLVRVGGTVVYSTCTLSPIQNDGVVHMALKRIWEDTNYLYVIKNLSTALERSRVMYKFANRGITKYGQLVLPYLPLNFGPTYFCKLQRIR